MTRLLPILLIIVFAEPAHAATPMITLDHGWQIQSSAKVPDTGDAISTSTFHPTGWYPATMPSTVLAALVANKVYPDPYFGLNLRSIPGTSYPVGRNFSTIAMPDDSPFRVPWWFRTEFAVPAAIRGQRLSLHFDGINYRANVWLNGRQIATSAEVAGTYRLYEFDITNAARTGGANVLAVEIFPPTPDDLAWTWVDWNPAPPDKNVGLWRPVSVTTSGPVTVRHALVVTTLANGSLDRADLAVSAEVHNLTDAAVHGVLHGRIDTGAPFNHSVDLAPHETRTVRFLAADVPALRVAHPKLWWPVDMGQPDLSHLDVDFQIGAIVSDAASLTFGMREIASSLDAAGARHFAINGRPLLIRGGGWAPDMLLREHPDRQDAELRYVRDMHLNTVRLEGKLEDEHFFDVADQYGILVLAGWCCCDRWEQWPRWNAENRLVASASQHDQICRLRSHPSVLAWMNGSDGPPPEDVERMYIDILKALDWPNPYISSAAGKRTSVTGASGVKMNGPYDWVPPSYWLIDSTHGGAFGFNTETSPGAAVPPIESLRKMLPVGHLWPIDDVWNYHAGGGQFKDLQSFTKALNARYGDATGLDDYAMKSQLMTYEGERAMFEAFGRNTGKATGVIQWMLNNAWPSMIWHLYDYFLEPGGGYFGTKKACEPVHIQYSYDDRSIVIVNTTAQARTGLTAAIKILTLDGTEKLSTVTMMDVAADNHASVALPDVAGLSPTYFLDLRVTDTAGKIVSTNFYWLGAKMDELDFAKSTWYTTPVTSYADFTALKDLPATTVKSAVLFTQNGGEAHARVTLTNTGKSVAFFLRLQLTKGADGDDVLPMLWEDNFISLLPGETRDIIATYTVTDQGAARPTLKVTGWNVR